MRPRKEVVYTIEQGIPAPTKRPASPITTALRSMLKGDSVLIPKLPVTYVQSYIARHVKKNPNQKFCTRTLSGGTRIWRIK